MNWWVCSDLHGYSDIYDQINEYINPEDKVIFLGDACDRGPNGYELIKKILNNPQWVYLKGNHDGDLFPKAARAILDMKEKNAYFDPYDYDVYLHKRNGGSNTLQDWIDDGMPIDIIEQLEQLSFKHIHYNKEGIPIYLIHSGYMNIDFGEVREYNALWDREQIALIHWSEKWPQIGYVIHGHTGVPHIGDYLSPYIKYEEPEEVKPFWYCDNKKCDIDMLTCVTGRAVLMNLDDFSYKMFHTSFPILY